MSSLLNNLNEILATKQEIKEIIQTESDLFSEYPAYIQQAIASGGATGYAYITTNGDHDIATYAMVNVQVPQEQVPYIPDGYTYVTGGKSITQNAEGIDISSYAYVDVAVPVPPEYIIPSGYAYITTNGDFDIRQFSAVNIEVPQGGSASGYAYITTNGDHDIAAYAMVNVEVPVPAGYIIPTGGKEILQNGTNIDISTYSYVDVAVPVPSGYIVPSGTYYAIQNGDYDITNYENVNINVPVPSGYIVPYGTVLVYENGLFDIKNYAYADISVSGGGITPSGTYYVTENGTFDITSYEYVDVSVSGSPVTTYTWSGLTRGGNPDVNQSGEQSDSENNSMLIYVKTGSGWTSKYTQIIPSRQFAYQLPSSITAREWADYDPSTYIMTDYSGCTYSCDPSNYDNLTNVMNTSGGSSGQDCSYEVSGLDVYGLSDYWIQNYGFFGSTVHNSSKLTDIKCIQWNTDDPSNPYEENVKSTMLCAALTDANHTAYIAETSYFQGMTDVRNLAGRTWKMIFNQYQGRLALKDIVGPVNGSEVYMNEIYEVWANWMHDWNGSTSSTYNTTTGNLELQYTANYIIGISSTPNTAELHQLEFQIGPDDTSYRIDCEVNGSLATADHTNLSGSVSLNVIPRTNENFRYTDLFYIDNADLQNEGYTQYDLTLTLKIPHDMWLYGSPNHDQMTLDWTLTPSSAVITDDVTALQTAIGTSWYTGNRISGSYDSSTDKWGTSTRKTNKSPSAIPDYKIYEINVTGTISSQQNLIPVITTPMALDYSNPSGSITCSMTERSDQNGVQILTLDTTDFPTKVNATFAIDVPNDALDSSSQNYMKCTITASIS